LRQVSDYLHEFAPAGDLLAGTPATVVAGTDRPDQGHHEQGVDPPADRAD
jgi:hypothetical protein